MKDLLEVGDYDVIFQSKVYPTYFMPSFDNFCRLSGFGGNKSPQSPRCAATGCNMKRMRVKRSVRKISDGLEEETWQKLEISSEKTIRKGTLLFLHQKSYEIVPFHYVSTEKILMKF